MSSSAALQAIKKFRLHEIKGLTSHIIRFGPLSPSSAAAAQSATNDSPASSSLVTRLPNPFVPRKNPKTGKWIEPKYSLRRQAELVKKARAAGLLHLLPAGPKNPIPVSAPKPSSVPLPAVETSAAEQNPTQVSKAEGGGVKAVWTVPVEWEGSREYKAVPGADLGTRLYAGKKRMFKGHKWERVKAKREARKRILLRDMDKRIYNYRNYYKRRRPDPLKPPRAAKAPKLPF